MSGSFFSALRDAARADWQRYVEHPFVRGLADGTLPEAAFRHYLAQDYLFLIDFARAYGLAAYKAGGLDEIRDAAEGLKAIVEVEMALHVAFCAEWGTDAAALEATERDSATLAYTCYVLERGTAGDLLDLRVALAPCILGYGEIGARLAADPATVTAGNPYARWIETYAGAAYQAAAEREAGALDALAARRGGEARFDGLAAIFRTATRLEAGFWRMGLDAARSGAAAGARGAP